MSPLQSILCYHLHFLGLSTCCAYGQWVSSSYSPTHNRTQCQSGSRVKALCFGFLITVFNIIIPIPWVNQDREGAATILMNLSPPLTLPISSSPHCNQIKGATFPSPFSLCILYKYIISSPWGNMLYCFFSRGHNNR